MTSPYFDQPHERPAPIASPGDTVVIYDGSLAKVERVYWERFFLPAHWIYKVRIHHNRLVLDLSEERIARLPANVIALHERQRHENPEVVA